VDHLGLVLYHVAKGRLVILILVLDLINKSYTKDYLPLLYIAKEALTRIRGILYKGATWFLCPQPYLRLVGERLLRVLNLIIESEVNNLIDDIIIERKEAITYNITDSVILVYVNITQDKSSLV